MHRDCPPTSKKLTNMCGVFIFKEKLFRDLSQTGTVLIYQDIEYHPTTVPQVE